MTKLRIEAWDRLSDITHAATAWRQAIIDTNGVAVAENALMAALEGRTLKEGYR